MILGLTLGLRALLLLFVLFGDVMRSEDCGKLKHTSCIYT